MKRLFYLDDVERDLIRCALSLWRLRLEKSETSGGQGHHYAANFTVGRIKELEKRLQEPPEGAA